MPYKDPVKERECKRIWAEKARNRNPEKYREANRRWKQRHRAQWNEYRRKFWKKRYWGDVEFRERKCRKARERYAANQEVRTAVLRRSARRNADLKLLKSLGAKSRDSIVLLGKGTGL